MSLVDFIPGYTAAKLLTSHIQGESITDYAYCRVTPSNCSASVKAAEDSCKKRIDGIMWKGILKLLPLCGIGLVKGAAGKSIQKLSKSLVKAAAAKGAKSSAASLLGPLGVGIMVLGVADALVAIYKVLAIIKAAEQAKIQYCKCG